MSVYWDLTVLEKIQISKQYTYRSWWMKVTNVCPPLLYRRVNKKFRRSAHRLLFCPNLAKSYSPPLTIWYLVLTCLFKVLQKYIEICPGTMWWIPVRILTLNTFASFKLENFDGRRGIYGDVWWEDGSIDMFDGRMGV